MLASLDGNLVFALAVGALESEEEESVTSLCNVFRSNRVSKCLISLPWEQIALLAFNQTKPLATSNAISLSLSDRSLTWGRSSWWSWPSFWRWASSVLRIPFVYDRNDACLGQRSTLYRLCTASLCVAVGERVLREWSFKREVPSDGVDRDSGGESGHLLEMSLLALGSF